MKRKILQIGNRTKSITLPQTWVNKFELNKGDHLEVSEVGDELVLKTGNKGTKNVEIDLKGSKKAMVEEFIVSHYQFGYDSLVLHFDPATFSFWDEKDVDTRKVIQDQCEQLIGFECVHLDRNKATIHDIMGVSSDDFQKVLGRIFHLLQTYSMDVHKGIEDKNLELLDFVSDQSKSMRKYSRYCLRYLSKVGERDNTPKYLYLISILDQARVGLRFVIKMHQNTHIKEDYSKAGLDVIKEVSSLFDDTYSVYYKFSMKKSSDIFEKRSKLVKKCYTLAGSKNKADAVVSQRLIHVMNTVWNINKVCIALNMGDENEFENNE